MFATKETLGWRILDCIFHANNITRDTGMSSYYFGNFIPTREDIGGEKFQGTLFIPDPPPLEIVAVFLAIGSIVSNC